MKPQANLRAKRDLKPNALVRVLRRAQGKAKLVLKPKLGVRVRLCLKSKQFMRAIAAVKTNLLLRAMWPLKPKGCLRAIILLKPKEGVRAAKTKILAAFYFYLQYLAPDGVRKHGKIIFCHPDPRGAGRRISRLMEKRDSSSAFGGLRMTERFLRRATTTSLFFRLENAIMKTPETAFLIQF